MRHVLVQPLGEFGRRGPRLGCILKNLPQPFQVLIGLRSDLAGNLPGAALDARIEQQQERHVLANLGAVAAQTERYSGAMPTRR